MRTKKFKSNRQALGVTILGLMLLSVGCGQSNPPADVPPAGPAPGAPLAPGQPAPPAPGQLPGPVQGCVPISQPIPFSFQEANVTYNQLLDSPQYIKIGQVPGQQPFGQVIMGGGQNQGSIQRQNVSGSSIRMSMLLPAAPQQGPGNGAAFLQLAPVIQQDIANQVMSGQIPGLQGQNLQGLCVSGIAINGGTYRNGQNLFFYGDVFLYLNGTPHGYVEKF